MLNALTTLAGVLGMIFVWGMIMSLPVMLLWDWLMPVLFGLGTITWLQAWGLSLLCNFLFRGHTANSRN
jgi:hypothetical protein